jgi:hypothetical protein
LVECEKLTDDRQRTPSDGKSSLCLWQGELKKEKDNKIRRAGGHLTEIKYGKPRFYGNMVT